MNLKKYRAIVKIEVARQFQHRFNVFSYRLGNFFEVLIPLVIWTEVYRKVPLIKGYTYDEMITYVVIG